MKLVLIIALALARCAMAEADGNPEAHVELEGVVQEPPEAWPPARPNRTRMQSEASRNMREGFASSDREDRSARELMEEAERVRDVQRPHGAPFTARSSKSLISAAYARGAAIRAGELDPDDDDDEPDDAA